MFLFLKRIYFLLSQGGTIRLIFAYFYIGFKGVCLSFLFLSACLSLWLSVFIFVWFLSVCLPLVFVFLPDYFFLCLYFLFLFVCLSVCLCFFLPRCLSSLLHPSVWLCVFLSAGLSVCLFVCLFSMSVCISIFLYLNVCLCAGCLSVECLMEKCQKGKGNSISERVKKYFEENFNKVSVSTLWRFIWSLYVWHPRFRPNSGQTEVGNKNNFFFL